MSSSHLQQKIDHLFDAHPLTLSRYFMVGALLSGVWAVLGHIWDLSFWANLLLGSLVLGWLIWIGPRYLQRKNRQRVLLLGTLAFFMPHFINGCMLWLGQPGWPLDDFMGRPYIDTGGLLSLFVFAGILYGILLLRMKMYDVVSVKRHSKKDLFQ